MTTFHQSHIIENYLTSNFPNSIYVQTGTNGMTNSVVVYEILERNKTSGTNSPQQKIVYKYFGTLSKYINRQEEAIITDKLYRQGLIPKVLDTDRLSYCIEEFYQGSRHFSKEEMRLNMNKVIPYIVKLNLSFGIIPYSLENQQFKLHAKCDLLRKPNEMPMKIIPDSQDRIISLISTGEKLLEDPNTSQSDIRFYEDCLLKLKRLSAFLGNFENEIMSSYPKKGLLCLNHHDIHPLNVLVNENNIDEMKFIDLEMSYLDLVGVDIGFLMTVMCYDCTYKEFPYFKFKGLDFDKAYETYKAYLGELYWRQRDMPYMSEIFTKEYFKKVTRISNLLLIAYGSNKVSFNRTSFFNLDSAITRIELYERLKN